MCDLRDGAAADENDLTGGGTGGGLEPAGVERLQPVAQRAVGGRPAGDGVADPLAVMAVVVRDRRDEISVVVRHMPGVVRPDKGDDHEQESERLRPEQHGYYTR